jgi:hypothetical protein
MGQHTTIRVVLDEQPDDDDSYFTFCLMCKGIHPDVRGDAKENLQRHEALRSELALDTSAAWLAVDSMHNYVILVGREAPECPLAMLDVELQAVVHVRTTNDEQMIREGWAEMHHGSILVCPNTGLQVRRQVFTADPNLKLSLIETYGGRAYLENSLVGLFTIKVKPKPVNKWLCANQQGNN